MGEAGVEIGLVTNGEGGKRYGEDEKETGGQEESRSGEGEGQEDRKETEVIIRSACKRFMSAGCNESHQAMRW